MLDQIVIVVAVTGLAMVTPGPDMILVLRNTLIGSRRAGLETSLGVLAGNLVHITYGVLGIGWVISQSIVAFSTLKYAGAAYLIYLGIMSFRPDRQQLKTTTGDSRVSTRTWYVQGFVNNLLNPKGALFYLGVFTTVIRPDTRWSTMAMLVFVMMGVSTTFWVVFVCSLDRPSVRGVMERSQRTVNHIFGAVLILFGLRVAFADR